MENKKNQPQALLDLVNFKSLLFRCLKNWYWFLLMLIVAVGFTKISLRYKDNVYQVNGSMLIKEDQTEQLSSQGLSGSVTSVTGQNFIGDQIQMLKSKRLMETVIRDMKMYKRFYTIGDVKSTETYHYKPIEIKEISEPYLFYNNSFVVSFIDSDNFSLSINEGDTLIGKYGDTIRHENLNFVLDFNYGFENDINIKIENPKYLAGFYARALQVKLIKNTHILSLQIEDPLPKRAIDVIYRLVRNYNEYVLEFKNNATFRTLDFIDDRLKFITKELYDVESDVEQFKKTNNITLQTNESARHAIDQIYKSDEDIAGLELEEQLLEELRKSIEKSSGKYNLLPASLDSKGGSIGQSINEYNRLVNERNRLLISAKEGNPAVKSTDKQLDLLKQTMLSSIELTLKDIQSRTNFLESKINPVEKQIKDIPKYERRLIQIMRQQKVKEALFTFLLQKREEYSMALASEINYTRIIDDPEVGLRVAPNAKKSYLMNVILALLIPGLVLLLKEMLDNKIRSIHDVEKYTKAPVLGTIIADDRDNTNALVITEKHDYSPQPEAFRFLRTNLMKHIQDVSKPNAAKACKKVLVTSTKQGEGKTYVSNNLAASMALAAHRSVVLSLDFQRTDTEELLTDQSVPHGVADYLQNQEITLSQILNPLAGINGLFFIKSGRMDRNPVDYFMSERMKALMQALEKEYDFVIIDTPALGMVSDAFVLRDMVDISFCVVREGLTSTDDLKIVKDVYQRNKLPLFSVIYNGIEKKKSLYGNKNSVKVKKWYQLFN